MNDPLLAFPRFDPNEPDKNLDLLGPTTIAVDGGGVGHTVEGMTAVRLVVGAVSTINATTGRPRWHDMLVVGDPAVLAELGYGMIQMAKNLADAEAHSSADYVDDEIVDDEGPMTV